MASERVRARVVSQFTRPIGFFGRLVGWEMALRSSNRRRNAWAVELLEVRTSDHTLEIGFGPGLAIRALSRRASDGLVCGIDHSEEMVRQATRRNLDAVRSGRVDLRLAGIEALPAFARPFDRVLAVNNVGMWRDPGERLREIRAAMARDGRIAIVAQPRCPGANAETSKEAGREIGELLASAGFVGVRTETLDLSPPAVCVLADAS